MKRYQTQKARLAEVLREVKEIIEDVYCDAIYEDLKTLGREDIEIPYGSEGWNTVMYNLYYHMNLHLKYCNEDLANATLDYIQQDTFSMAETLIEWDTQEKAREEQ